MTIADLINQLMSLDQDPGTTPVMILDGPKGGGSPRTISFTPELYLVSSEDAAHTDDCKNLVGTTVVIMGYG
jgi:hypothetical protein